MNGTKIFAGMAASLDGYIATHNGELSWLNEAMSPDDNYGFAETMARTGAYILGAKTYLETVTAGQFGGDTTPTYVVTHRTDLPRAGDHVRFFSGDLRALAAQARAETDRDIWVFGGGDLITQFIDLGLLDELNIAFVPVLLGDGVRLFGRLDGWKKLRLAEAKPFKSGIVSVRYEVERDGKSGQ